MVLITPICFDSIGYYTYTIFAVINLLIGVAIYFLYPGASPRAPSPPPCAAFLPCAC